MQTICPVQNEEPLKLLHRCGGYYECPKDSSGKRLGPLVGYAGRYGEQNLQYVGDVYANFAQAERHGPVLNSFAATLKAKLSEIGTGFCGAPEGGKALATALAIQCSSQYIFAEKKVTALATASTREKSDLVFARHTPQPGEHWWIAEDVCNNFSTTDDLAAAILKHGAEVAGIVCFLNRSLTVDTVYTSNSLVLPVIAVVRKPINEWKQDDPAVNGDVQRKNVIWKPKFNWDQLMTAMSV